MKNTDMYKLIKEFGALKKGDVVARRWKMCDSNCVDSDYYCRVIDNHYDYDYELHLKLVQNNTEFFTPYCFTTKDGVDMYKGENYYYIGRNNGVCTSKAYSKSEPTLPFSTKEAAETYLLIEEAKRKYPIGTKFYPSHVSKENCEEYYTVKSHNLERADEFPNYISFISEKKDIWTANVYSRGKWAEIVEDVKIGDYITYNDELTFKVANIKLGSYIAESGKSYDKVFCRKASKKEEILAYYESLGWLKGAKFTTNDKKVYTLEYLNIFSDGVYCANENKSSIRNIKDCTLVKDKQYTWEECYKGGYFTTPESNITYNRHFQVTEKRKNQFKTKKQAQSVLAFAQLSQIVVEMNGSWVADWTDDTQTKYYVARINNRLQISYTGYGFRPLVFKSAELRNLSLEQHRKLWEQYYELE